MLNLAGGSTPGDVPREQTSLGQRLEDLDQAVVQVVEDIVCPRDVEDDRRLVDPCRAPAESYPDSHEEELESEGYRM